jgi:signal transduction histidine kinase
MKGKDKSIPQIEYAQNLSHELLTPLAVIRSKAELLMQSPNLEKEDLLHIDTILQSVERMFRLNRALITLSKLDNEVFVDREDFNLFDLVSECLEKFEDHIRKNNLQVRIRKSDPILLNSNRNLVEILLTNLIKNAVLHNHDGGNIDLAVEGKNFIISNSTNKKIPENLYSRFSSGEHTDESLGLGLAIAKKICHYLSIRMDHQKEDKRFTISLNF